MSAPVRVEPVEVEPVAAAPVERTSSTSSGAGDTSFLAKEAAEGVQILERLSDVCKAQFQCPPMSPSYVSESKAVILLRGTKAGLGLGFRSGHGMLLVRMPTEAASDPPRWSAPVFLKVNVGQIGFIAGIEHVDSFMLAMTNKVLDQLLLGSHTVLGVDQSMVVLQAEVEDKSDIIAASNKALDLVGVSHSSGVMLDFSLSGGSMSVNHAKMRQAYGKGVGMAEVMKGMVPAPHEMAPLYEKLGEMVAGGTTPKISLTTTSLERFTAGYDPDRRIFAEEPGSTFEAPLPTTPTATAHTRTAAVSPGQPVRTAVTPAGPAVVRQAAAAAPAAAVQAAAHRVAAPAAVAPAAATTSSEIAGGAAHPASTERVTQRSA
ncbi:hypothetical protein ABPG77_004125 [Micractinium sp. CCAP 211/92]